MEYEYLYRQLSDVKIEELKTLQPFEAEERIEEQREAWDDRRSELKKNFRKIQERDREKRAGAVLPFFQEMQESFTGLAEALFLEKQYGLSEGDFPQSGFADCAKLANDAIAVCGEHVNEIPTKEYRDAMKNMNQLEQVKNKSMFALILRALFCIALWGGTVWFMNSSFGLSILERPELENAGMMLAIVLFFVLFVIAVGGIGMNLLWSAVAAFVLESVVIYIVPKYISGPIFRWLFPATQYVSSEVSYILLTVVFIILLYITFKSALIPIVKNLGAISKGGKTRQVKRAMKKYFAKLESERTLYGQLNDIAVIYEAQLRLGNTKNPPLLENDSKVQEAAALRAYFKELCGLYDKAMNIAYKKIGTTHQQNG